MTLEQARTINAGEKVKLLTPHMTAPEVIEFRGLLDMDKAVLWSGKSQFSTSIEWITKIDSGVKWNPANEIQSVADDIESLRPCDVYRVLAETSNEHREEMRSFIVKNHAYNQRILDEVRKAWDVINM